MRKRMTKLLGFILAVLAAAAFISCEEEIPFNGKYSGEKLVLFSTVNPDSGRIAVSVSSSRFFLDKYQNYQGRMVSGAIVTVKTDNGAFMNRLTDSFIVFNLTVLSN